MAKKKTSQQPAPAKDTPQAPAQDQAQATAPARITTVSLTTCLVSVVVALALGLCIGSMLPDPRRPIRPSSPPRNSRRRPSSRPGPAFPPN